jgi:Skp family chaperone for outer membrane proteins
MTMPRTLKVAALVLALAGAGWLFNPVAKGQGPAVAAAAGPKVKTPVIAVVDVKKVLDVVKENVQIQAEMQDMISNLDAEATARQKELKKLQDDLGMLAADSREYMRMAEDLEQKVVNYKSWREYQQHKLERERVLRWELLYKRMVDAVGRAAQQNGADLVLFKEPMPDFRSADPRDVIAAIQNRKLLYSSDDLDLTAQVVQMMDNDYKNRGGTLTPATQPAKQP